MRTIIIIGIILILVGIIIWLWYDKKEKERKAEEEREKRAPKEGFRVFIKMIKRIIKAAKVIKQILSRIKHVAYGIAHGAIGFGIAVVNMPQAAVISYTDQFNVAIQTAKYGFRWVVCSIEKIHNLHYCIFFYIIDAIISSIETTVRSIFYFVDEFFGLPELFNGNGLIVTLDKIIEYIEEADDIVYSNSGYHIFSYPEAIQEMCYRCKLPLNTKDVRRANRIMRHNAMYRIPPLTQEYTDRFMKAGEEFGKVFEGM
jgi:hypothetical protein